MSEKTIADSLSKRKEKSALRRDWFLDPGCRVFQNPDHFCFNSDSFALASFVKVRKGERILEIGTNNGALLCYLARFEPGFLCGVEILEEPALLARKNLAEHARCPWKIDQGDIRTLPAEEFDLIVCNPPYFRAGSSECPSFDQADLRQKGRFEFSLNLEQMIDQAAARLISGGRFCFVHRPERLARAMEYMKIKRITPSRLQIAYDVRDHQAKAILLEGVKDLHPDLKIEPPCWYGRKPS